MKLIQISEATPTQLSQFATESLGLPNCPPSLGAAKLVAKIREAHEGDTISLPDEFDPPSAPSGVVSGASMIPPTGVRAAVKGDAITSKDGIDRRKVKLMIPISKEPGGARPVEVAVNGVLMRLTRGIEIEIPYPYFEALQNAKERTPVVDENGTPIAWTDSHLYPHNFLGIREVAETSKAAAS